MAEFTSQTSPPVGVFSDYRAFLRSRWEAVRGRRPNFSQGAFARTIGIPPNRMSEVLRGKQGISPATATKIAKRLGLEPEEETVFCDLVTSLHGRSRLERISASERIKRRKRALPHESLSPEKFSSISDWFNFGILEILQDGKKSALELSKALGLPRLKIQEALKNLKRLGFVAFENGDWRSLNRSLEVKGGLPSQAIRKFHRQVMGRAEKAIETIPVNEREYLTLLVRANPQKIEWVRKQMQEFWAMIERELENEDGVKQLYALGMQYFPLGK